MGVGGTIVFTQVSYSAPLALLGEMNTTDFTALVFTYWMSTANSDDT